VVDFYNVYEMLLNCSNKGRETYAMVESYKTVVFNVQDTLK